MKAARTSSGLPQAERSTFESTLQSGRARVQINHMGVRLNRAPFVILRPRPGRARTLSGGRNLPSARPRRSRSSKAWRRGDAGAIAMDFAELEKKEGVRLSWNAWPSSRIEATRVVLPFGAVCTPCKPMPEMPVLPYAPVVCNECSAVLNPHCMVDYHQKRWQCCLCNVMNNLPRNYHGEAADTRRGVEPAVDARDAGPARVLTPRGILFVTSHPTHPRVARSRVVSSRGAAPSAARPDPAADLPPDDAHSRAPLLFEFNPARLLTNPIPPPPPRAEINENNLPAELFPGYTTVEYQMDNKNPRPPCFMLVLDTATTAEELQDAKDSLGQLVALLPEECLVGLITFGATVTVHELCDGPMPKSYVLRGTDDVTQEQLKKLLGLELSPHEHAAYNKQRGSAVAEANSALRRFILPVSECEFTLQTILDELTPDPFPREAGMRPYRATGVAIAAAAGLLAESHSAQGGRVMVFTSGPCTLGPGTIVGRDLGENLRTHQDFNKGSAKLFKAANKYYNSLGIRLATHAHTLDVFACSLDQVGLAEMKTAVDQTGGVMVLAEQFRAETFRSSLRGLFKRDASGALDMYFNATFSVFCVPQVMVCGGIGPMSALAVKSKSISENEVGMGQTTSWRVCSLNTTTSVAVYYEIVNQHSNPIPAGDALLPPVLRPVQAQQRGDSVAGDDRRAPVGREQRGARDRRRVRSGGERAAHGEGEHVPGGARGDVRLAAMARSHAHSRRVQIRRVRAGRAGDVPHARSHGHLPAIHVQPPPVAVFADCQQLAGRDGVLPPDDWSRDGAQLAGDDPTHPDVVHLQRTAAARAVGRGEHPAGLHPPPGHLLHDRRPRRADHRRVAQGELPGATRARGVSESPGETRGGRRGGDGAAVSHPATRGVRPGGSQARFLLAKLNPSATHATSDAGGAVGAGGYDAAMGGYGGEGARARRSS